MEKLMNKSKEFKDYTFADFERVPRCKTAEVSWLNATNTSQ